MAKSPQRQPAKSAWAQAAAAAASDFQEGLARERKVGGGFVLPNIADGEYIAELNEVELGIVEKAGPNNQADIGKPLVNFKLVVQDHPEYHGTPLNIRIVIKESAKMTVADAWNRVFNQFYGAGYDLDPNSSLEDIEALANEITNAPVLVKVQVRNGEYNGRRTLNTDIIGVPEGDEGEDGGGTQFDEPEPEPAPPPVKAPARSAKAPAKKAAPKGRR